MQTGPLPRSASTVLSFAFLALAWGCGGNQPEPATPTNAETHGEKKEHHGEHKGEHKGEHHGELSPALTEFHEALRPLWHMDKGQERVAKTCEKAVRLREKAEVTKDQELVVATSALVSECEKEGRPDFEAKFGVVHKRFHELAEKK